MKENKFDKKSLPSILPFLLLGIGIAILVSLIVMFFYLFMWGVIIGFILWAIMTLKEKFFPTAKGQDSNHKVLHVEEDGSVVVEEESSPSAHKPHVHKHSHKK